MVRVIRVIQRAEGLERFRDIADLDAAPAAGTVDLAEEHEVVEVLRRLRRSRARCPSVPSASAWASMWCAMRNCVRVVIVPCSAANPAATSPAVASTHMPVQWHGTDCAYPGADMAIVVVSADTEPAGVRHPWDRSYHFAARRGDSIC